MKRKGFTVVELMISLIIIVVLLTALWRIFSASRRNAHEIMENHALNDKLDVALIKMIDDIREANAVEEYPILYEKEKVETLTTDGEENKLVFIKANYEFWKSPRDIPEGEVNYKSNLITYFVQRSDDNPEKWDIMREMVAIDVNKEEIQGEGNHTLEIVLPSVDECIFYRVIDPDAARTGNIYIKIKLGRNDNGVYSNESIISVKERGAMPES